VVGVDGRAVLCDLSIFLTSLVLDPPISGALGRRFETDDAAFGVLADVLDTPWLVGVESFDFFFIFV